MTRGQQQDWGKRPSGEKLVSQSEKVLGGPGKNEDGSKHLEITYKLKEKVSIKGRSRNCEKNTGVRGRGEEYYGVRKEGTINLG